MNEKLTERAYSIDLTRPNTGSHLVISVQAVSTAQAIRKAENEFPGWVAKAT